MVRWPTTTDLARGSGKGESGGRASDVDRPGTCDVLEGGSLRLSIAQVSKSRPILVIQATDIQLIEFYDGPFWRSKAQFMAQGLVLHKYTNIREPSLVRLGNSQQFLDLNTIAWRFLNTNHDSSTASPYSIFVVQFLDVFCKTLTPVFMLLASVERIIHFVAIFVCIRDPNNYEDCYYFEQFLRDLITGTMYDNAQHGKLSHDNPDLVDIVGWEFDPGTMLETSYRVYKGGTSRDMGTQTVEGKFTFEGWQPRRSSFDISDSSKGRSMLVAAIMDIVTSNCDNVDKIRLKPMLSGAAAMRDIAAALQVVEEGGMHMDEPPGSQDDDDGGTGLKGIGIKVLGGTTVVGLSRSNGSMDLEESHATHSASFKSTAKTLPFNKLNDNSPAHTSLPSAVIPGLWDDLHSQHVAVPFAAWALANWAMASDVNRSHIQELDQDGHAVMSALVAPERSVKWHGSLVARLLLEDQNLQMNDFVSDWSSSLLTTVSQASKTDDISLTRVALSAFLVSIERCPGAQKAVMDKGLHLMRETAKRTMDHKFVQEALAKGLELLCSGDMHLSLEEGQKWSCILLPWVFRETSSDAIRSSAITILSRICEDYGPSSVPISQGWLAIMLSDILQSRKLSLKGSAQPRDKVKTQIDQSNVVSGTQSVNQLASAVVNLAVNQLGTESVNGDLYALADFLCLEPFVRTYKNLKKDSVPKVNAADSALATLKGIKAMTEICSDDSFCQSKIVDYGVIPLLRRFLLRDDYEKLSAIEAYDASRDMEARDRPVSVHGESSVSDARDPSSVRVPPTAHVRRHAARLLTVLSVHPKVKKLILDDKAWCNWLEECASGKIAGCNDLKTQSYARATLLNIFCNDDDSRDIVNSGHPDGTNKNHSCARYTEMIFLINPEMPHWECLGKGRQESAVDTSTENENRIDPFFIVDKETTDGEDGPFTKAPSDASIPNSNNRSESHSGDPSLDVIFVHGMRGGPFKTWRLSECKSSSKSGLVEKIDEEAGKHGTFWPGEWLSTDFPHARLFSLKYKTNLTQWSGSSLPLQEVSSMLLEKLIAARIGDRPVVFVTHSMGGLVVKQMLHQASAENRGNLVRNTVGVVFYSCPHFGSKLADMPWRMGYVFRPAPSIGELRSGSTRLVELNDFLRDLHKKGSLDVLSFCETKVTPIVEGYGGWAFRLEIVPIESAYPGYGELVVLESTDHVNSCKPISRTDPSYSETLVFLHKLRAAHR